MAFKTVLKRFVFGLLGKDPEAVVVSFVSGDEVLARQMTEEIWSLVPDRRHYVVRLGAATGWEQPPVISLTPGTAWNLYRQIRREFRSLRIGQAVVLLAGGGSAHRALRLAAFLAAPRKVLAYNAALERHHLRLGTWIASWLFLRGVPLDRIYLRPWWLCPWKRDRTIRPDNVQVIEGRPLSETRRRVAVLSPYFPYPLSHGGAVRIFHLLKEASRRFDVFLFAFTESGPPAEIGPVMEFCAKAVLVPKPRYREPRWSSLKPPEVCEYESPAMRKALHEFRREHSIELLQTEYTQLADYGGDLLVEHDVTFDLYQQVHAARRRFTTWWDLKRWMWYERRAIRRFRCVVAMSDKDAGLLGAGHVRVIPNGVDLERFQPAPETPGQRLLFIGSFRHFPNIVAFRFLTEEVWPKLRSWLPEITLTVVAGPEPAVFWKAVCGSAMPEPAPGIRLLEFVRDVQPLYAETNLVVVPTLVSAGTNVKVLEAMASERAVVSTTSGCAGLGLEHGKSVWIADGAEEFAQGIRRLITDDHLRRSLAQEARRLAEAQFSWRRLGALQRALWSELLGEPLLIREAGAGDLEDIRVIQAASPKASSWPPEDYLGGGCLVAVRDGRTVGFLAYRKIAPGESEVLNLAVAPEARRQGIASKLVEEVVARLGGCLWLEVRPSNVAARNLYQKLGFRERGRRKDYYQDPPEDGIVMELQSC